MLHMGMNAGCATETFLGILLNWGFLLRSRAFCTCVATNYLLRTDCQTRLLTKVSNIWGLHFRSCTCRRSCSSTRQVDRRQPQPGRQHFTGARHHTSHRTRLHSTSSATDIRCQESSINYQRPENVTLILRNRVNSSYANHAHPKLWSAKPKKPEMCLVSQFDDICVTNPIQAKNPRFQLTKSQANSRKRLAAMSLPKRTRTWELQSRIRLHCNLIQEMDSPKRSSKKHNLSRKLGFIKRFRRQTRKPDEKIDLRI